MAIAAVHERTEPSEWVVRYARAIPPAGRVLDVACGQGRHARFLRDLGHPVVALDRDAAALATLEDEAGIEAVQADIESGPWPFAPGNFDALVVTNYLHRPLFPDLIAALRPGGVLIYETFARGNERYGRPANPDFLLAPGELLERLRGALTVVGFEHGVVNRPKPAVIQRVCAVLGDTFLYTFEAPEGRSEGPVGIK